MTSAPRSARFWLHHGPARMRVRSRTRRWESGPGIATIPYSAYHNSQAAGGCRRPGCRHRSRPRLAGAQGVVVAAQRSLLMAAIQQERLLLLAVALAAAALLFL